MYGLNKLERHMIWTYEPIIEDHKLWTVHMGWTTKQPSVELLLQRYKKKMKDNVWILWATKKISSYLPTYEDGTDGVFCNVRI